MIFDILQELVELFGDLIYLILLIVIVLAMSVVAGVSLQILWVVAVYKMMGYFL